MLSKAQLQMFLRLHAKNKHKKTKMFDSQEMYDHNSIMYIRQIFTYQRILKSEGLSLYLLSFPRCLSPAFLAYFLSSISLITKAFMHLAFWHTISNVRHRVYALRENTTVKVCSFERPVSSAPKVTEHG